MARFGDDVVHVEEAVRHRLVDLEVHVRPPPNPPHPRCERHRIVKERVDAADDARERGEGGELRVGHEEGGDERVARVHLGWDVRLDAQLQDAEREEHIEEGEEARWRPGVSQVESGVRQAQACEG